MLRNRTISGRSIRQLFATFLLLGIVMGCGPKSASVSGKVTLQDVPITTGTIAFISTKGIVSTGNIENGNYYVTGLEIGFEATVTVTSHAPSPMMQPPRGPVDGAPIQPPMKYIPIPDRYGDSNLSGLTCQVIEIEQTKDFDLKP
ncbi:hypothetical protein [Bythopirellula polymerisocia]|nr:hypothetical protein [Bythopirellula polymerisocia]